MSNSKVKKEKAKAVIEIELPSAKIAAAALKALKIETGVQGRSTVKLSRKGRKLGAVIASKDIAALHAAFGSLMRAMKVFTAIASHALHARMRLKV